MAVARIHVLISVTQDLLIETGRTNGVFSVVIVVERSVTAECAASGGEKVLPIMKITLHTVKNELWTSTNVVTAKYDTA
jgi:hypothetical protein